MTDILPRGETTAGEQAKAYSDGRADLVLAAAKILFENGQSTDQTVATAVRLASALNISATVIARWGELSLVSGAGERRTYVVAANPAGVEMDRVAAASTMSDDVAAGRLTVDEATRLIGTIAERPPAPTWQFVLAAGAAALALGVIFGLQHVSTAIIIFLSAALGALLRRRLSLLSRNLYLQPFCAALLAGVVGAVAVRCQFSTSLRLVAVCPCMVLVPGPHVLNGTMDLICGRISLGGSRLLFAGLVITAITAGLLLGFSLFGVSLPVDPIAPAVPLWMDMAAAGVAVLGYAIFFSMPLRMAVWPMLAGVVAHGVRWMALAHGQSVTIGALLACVVAGVMLTPIARRRHMPFAMIGFAAVVSMIPGVFIFRMMSALLGVGADSAGASGTLADAVANGMTAAMIVAAMSVGLIVPKLIIDRTDEARLQKRPRS